MSLIIVQIIIRYLKTNLFISKLQVISIIDEYLNLMKS